MAKFGPFTHGLNKGGLSIIRATGQLKASEARQIAGGSSAVRAWHGSFAERRKKMNWNDPADTYIEFTTDTANSRDGHPAIATWPMPEGAALKIEILGVYNGTGKKLP